MNTNSGVAVSWRMGNEDINSIPDDQQILLAILNDRRRIFYTRKFTKNELLQLSKNGDIQYTLYDIDPKQINSLILYLYKSKFNTKQKLLETSIRIGSSKIDYLSKSNIKTVSYDPRDCTIIKETTQCIPACTPSVFGSQAPRLQYEVENISQFPENGGIGCPRGHVDNYPYRDDTTVKECPPKNCQDCRGSFSAWSPCSGDDFRSYRTYNVEAQPDELGRPCINEDGYKKSKTCMPEQTQSFSKIPLEVNGSRIENKEQFWDAGGGTVISTNGTDSNRSWRIFGVAYPRNQPNTQALYKNGDDLLYIKNIEGRDTRYPTWRGYRVMAAKFKKNDLTLFDPYVDMGRQVNAFSKIDGMYDEAHSVPELNDPKYVVAEIEENNVVTGETSKYECKTIDVEKGVPMFGEPQKAPVWTYDTLMKQQNKEDVTYSRLGGDGCVPCGQLAEDYVTEKLGHTPDPVNDVYRRGSNWYPEPKGCHYTKYIAPSVSAQILGGYTQSRQQLEKYETERFGPDDRCFSIVECKNQTYNVTDNSKILKSISYKPPPRLVIFSKQTVGVSPSSHFRKGNVKMTTAKDKYDRDYDLLNTVKTIVDIINPQTFTLRKYIDKILHINKATVDGHSVRPNIYITIALLNSDNINHVSINNVPLWKADSDINIYVYGHNCQLDEKNEYVIHPYYLRDARIRDMGIDVDDDSYEQAAYEVLRAPPGNENGGFSIFPNRDWAKMISDYGNDEEMRKRLITLQRQHENSFSGSVWDLEIKFNPNVV